MLSALEFGLSTSSKPAEELFIHRDFDADQLWVEMTFFELTDQERTTFKRYVLSEDTMMNKKNGPNPKRGY
ncbi:MAG: hypothetical protein U5K33_07035 [Halofilum sp. (in: g-proteobacteria)]|nr:hypothetical protein [Halofilum sp. (in: g-proteobacteria)]